MNAERSAVFGTAAAIVVIMGVTLLPFLPGAYDPLALPLSMMTRVLGLAGLLLVPIGILWFGSWHWKSLLVRRRVIAIAAWLAAALVWAAVSLSAFALQGVSLAVISAVVGGQRFTGGRGGRRA